MAPKYKLYSGFAVKDALAAAGAPSYKSKYQEGEPPVTFFTQAPKNAAAVFSTLFGTRPFRLVQNPTSEREGHYWWAAEIQRVCDELRRNLPEVCRGIEMPQSYWDLYKYFDAYDIYYRGAQNLWNVINTFVFENQYALQVIDKEQKMQTEQYLPLFETLASELVRKPETQTKLLAWDRARQIDVLKVLTPYELQIFEGYERYPNHFLEAIRVILLRHHQNLREESGSFTSRLAPNSGRMPNMTVSEQLASLRRYLQCIETDDPFMDKFEIPNRIINGIVIADGTSETAARKARQDGKTPFINGLTRGRAGQGNGTNGPHSKASPLWGSGWFSKERSGTTERCSSAPSIGGNPANILSNPTSKEARVYPGDDHEVDKKLMGCQKPASPKDAGDDNPITVDAPQSVTPTSNNHSQPALSSTDQTMPPIRSHEIQYQGNHRRPSPSPQPMLPSAPNFVPGLVPLPQVPETRDRGVSQGPFAHQVPPYSCLQPNMEGPPMMQQTQYSHPVYMQSNKGGYTMNTMPHYFQAGPMQSLAYSGNSEDSKQHKWNFSSRNNSNGRWHHIGSDDIHGPKVVFHKGSTHSREPQTGRVGQWQGKERNESGRRTSAASNSGNYHRFNNYHTQRYTDHTDHRYTGRGVAPTGTGLQTSSASGPTAVAWPCVNINKRIDTATKFDPCTCIRCSDRDRTIFVSGLRDGVNKTEGGLERLRQHFSKFGHVDDVIPIPYTSAHIKFLSPQSAAAAVHTDQNVQVDDLGDGPLQVYFRTGSQFFIPRSSRNWRNTTRTLQVIGPDFPADPETSLSSGVAPVSQKPAANLDAASTHAMDATNPAATQSGHESNKTGQPPYPGMTTPVIRPHPIHGLVVVDARNTRDSTKHQQKQSSLFNRILSGESIKEMATDIMNDTNNVMPSHPVSPNTTPAKSARPDHDPAQEVVPTSNAQDSLIGIPRDGYSDETGKAGSIDYGTVRVRPGKARYVAIPPAWRQEPAATDDKEESTSQHVNIATAQDGAASIGVSTPSSNKAHEETGTTERRTEDAHAPLQHESGENTIRSEHEKASGKDGSSSLTKPRPSGTDGDEEVLNQPSPKKFFETMQPPSSAARPQSPETGHKQQKQRAGETAQAKYGKNKKKNKKRQSQATKPAMSENTPPPTAHGVHAFNPALAAPLLPSYPQHIVQRPAVPHVLEPSRMHEPFYVHVPPTPPRFVHRLSGSEPFPPYRDLMSGPQFSPVGHNSYGTGFGPNRSISSNASTIIHNLSPIRGGGLNPWAGDFIPGPSHTRHRNLTLSSIAQAPATSNSHGDMAHFLPPCPVWSPQAVRTQEAPQPRVQKSLERIDSDMPTPNQPAIQESKPTEPLPAKADDSKEEIENSKNIAAKDETAPKTAVKENNEIKTTTGANKGGGKGKGKSKNAKAGRKDQKSPSKVTAERKGESTGSDGSKNTSPRKAKTPGGRKVEAPKSDPAAKVTNADPIVEMPAEEPPRRDGAKGAKGTKSGHSEKGEGKGVPAAEEKPVAKFAETATTTEVSPEKGKTEGKAPTPPKSRADPGTSKTSETKTPPTPGTPAPKSGSSKPKQGKAKNRAPKKGAGTSQPPPIGTPGTTTTTNTTNSGTEDSKPEPTKGTEQAKKSKGAGPHPDAAENNKPKTESALLADGSEPTASSSSPPTNTTTASGEAKDDEPEKGKVKAEKKTGKETEGVGEDTGNKKDEKNKEEEEERRGLKPLPALAPIPLYVPGTAWRRVGSAPAPATGKKTLPQTQAQAQVRVQVQVEGVVETLEAEAKAEAEAEKGPPPGGERKGG